ncbi:bifunctional diguanylate cyclase/phosphodiesterase [Leptospira semungkisensis]|uniref:Bifunctional diguanylate cyclase/phosphodiesterase n=1 Tax=Leptospira semungkisensis TaxID=2484985 RepID=A0A4R9FP69_9LEPT|nr:bifunctional diguanylate cyclase/phosphodiesterase [Leptospira semungkisensis]TGJ99556.1 bifunctional diguanylate cyclase/phosphodiesterase [Leptospira semungkisensis]
MNYFQATDSNSESEVFLPMLRYVADNSTEIIFIVADNDTIIYANENFSRLIDTPRIDPQAEHKFWTQYFSTEAVRSIKYSLLSEDGDCNNQIKYEFYPKEDISIQIDFRISKLEKGYTIFIGRTSSNGYSQIPNDPIEGNSVYSDLIERTNDIFYELSTDGRIRYLNPAFQKVTGWEVEEWIGKKFYSLIHPKDQSLLFSRFKEAVRYGSSSTEQTIQLKTKNGGYLDFDFQIFLITTEDGRSKVSGIGRDVTTTVLKLRKYKFHALHDDLCKIPNRKYFKNRLEDAFHDCPSHKPSCLAVIFIDIDRFKYINDTLGHLIGNEVISSIGKRLKQIFLDSSNIFFGRLGGDEFALLITDFQSIESVTSLVEDMRAKLQEPILLSDGYKVNITISIGIAIKTELYQNSNELLRDADIALYNVKARGGNGFDIFVPQMYVNMKSAFNLETDLRNAIYNESLTLNFQPIYSWKHKQIICFESLIRWNHPKYGMVSPAEFIAIAEKSGLILDIGDLAFKLACQQLQRMQDRGIMIPISINVSPIQFFRQDLAGLVRKYCREYGVSSKLIRIEITEGLDFHSLPKSIKIMQELQELGIQIYMDDFGTGYSSLNYLLNFPIDALKIDQSFISQYGVDLKATTIVKTIIQLGKCLNIPVIAEGLESKKAYRALRAINCEFMQGYLLGKPLPGSEILKIKPNRLKI